MMMMTMININYAYPLQQRRSLHAFFLIYITFAVTNVQSLIQCQTSQECVDILREGSECVDGICSNPFEQGCLRRYLGNAKFPTKRICNSHDPPNAQETGLCDLPVFNYTEFRILSQDWDSTMLTSWVMQIVLSEILQVPASIETSSPERNNNFYDPDSAYSYSLAYDFDALRAASDYGGNCEDIVRQNNQHKEDPNYVYQSCANVMPEAWDGQEDNIKRLEEEHTIEPAEGAGGVSQAGWYIPKFVAEKNHSLLSHFGLSGQEGRHMLADTFHRPTTWHDYCTQVSPTNCTVDDGIAARPPQPDSDEGQYYFVEESFKGHFRRTEENDCETYPETCTGHITNVVCTWSTFAVPQAYYADIAVESNGPTSNGGYPFKRMTEIWKAANATKSPVMFYWFTPDRTVQEFVNTEGEFQQILMPNPTQTCIEHRVPVEGRCSADPIDQVGSSLGACGSHVQPYKKLIASNLFESNLDIAEALQSPAYEVISDFQISDLQINEIFDHWYERGTDRWNYDPREAVCQWTAQNLDELMRFVPRTYPRTIRAMGYAQPVLYVAIALGIFACLSVVSTAMAVYKLRKTPVMQTGQVEFMMMLLLGLLLVAIASILVAINPTPMTCVILSWLVCMGYTLELAPLIVKVSAIIKLMKASRRLRRMHISRRQLFKQVAVIIFLVSVFLTCWTIIDPNTKEEQYSLTDAVNEEGGTVVQHCYFCGSTNDLWRYAAMAWQVILLLCATVLAVQSRTMRSEFNETQSLAFMVYSHSVFVVFRAVLMIWEDKLQASMLAAFLSYIYSIDTMLALGSYFLPKFLTIIHQRRSSSIGAGTIAISGASYPTSNNSKSYSGSGSVSKFSTSCQRNRAISFADTTESQRPSENSSTDSRRTSSSLLRRSSFLVPAALGGVSEKSYDDGEVGFVAGLEEDEDTTEPEDVEDSSHSHSVEEDTAEPEDLEVQRPTVPCDHR